MSKHSSQEEQDWSPWGAYKDKIEMLMMKVGSRSQKVGRASLCWKLGEIIEIVTKSNYGRHNWHVGHKYRISNLI